MQRRGFFQRIADGMTGMALLQLFARDFGIPVSSLAAEHAGATARSFDLTPRPTHFRPRARRVIQLFMQGGPSQVDLLDPKPLLDRYHGRPVFGQLAKDVSSPDAAGGLMRSPFRFSQHGESGMWLSELLPHTARHADEIAVIRSMFNSHPNHEPALFKIHSGKLLPGLPSLGSWIAYGLGSESQSLPAYVVLDSPDGALPVNTVQNWQCGYLPPLYQGTRMRSKGTPVLNLKPDEEEPSEVERLSRDLLARLDQRHREQRPGQLQLDARISSYQLAARMQLSASDALDLSQETEETQTLYGIGQKETDSYGRQCLLARRLIERGVRFVQVYTVSQRWDNHTNIGTSLPAICRTTDQPAAALLTDLARRGLLEDTLVLWGGEFGRLPMAQMRPDQPVEKAGRDHGPAGFSVWLAGAGIRGGTVYGATDEMGYKAVENPVSVADWHATILHALGMSHERLFFENHGLKERLTGVEKPRVISELFS